MVIVLFAGLLAQKKFYPDSSNNSAGHDEQKIQQYLDAIYGMDKTSESIARKYLEQEAGLLADHFGDAIKRVAETLWAKECTTRVKSWGSDLPLEKNVGASEIVEILKDWNISCGIDDCTPEDDPAKVED